MRVAEIAPLTHPVPPAGEGSVETIVSAITEGLVRRGHDVTLFATADSKTSAELRSPVEVGYTRDPEKWDWQLYEAHSVREAFRAWPEFDVIHCHAYHFGLLFCDFVPIPSVHSLHVEPGPDWLFLAQRTANRHLVFCSQHQAREFGDVTGVHVVPHGVDVDAFHVSESPGEHLLFIGRCLPEKGPLEAIRLARAAGAPLRIAAPGNDHLREEIGPEVDGKMIEYLGEIRGREKADVLATARALLYPVQRGEPFGLVLVEAMASGLPVLALNRGAVPEIVEQGVTGWIGETEEDLIAGLERVDALDRRAIRRRAAERFSIEQMVDRHEQLLMQVVEESNR
jgi:glycosyltransferase involved in cell wall biosynthesis